MRTQEQFLEGLITWVKENKDQVVIILATLIFLIALIPILMNYNVKSKKQAWDMYAQMQSNFYRGSFSDAVAQSSNIISQYGKTNAAKFAFLTKANSLFFLREYDQVINTYDNFLNKYKKSELVPIALYGKAYAQELLGKFEEAVLSYDTIINEYSDSYILAEAYFNKARCIELSGDRAGADEAYKIVSTMFPQTQWQIMAKSRIEALK